jgi:hypothetical protein
MSLAANLEGYEHQKLIQERSVGKFRYSHMLTVALPNGRYRIHEDQKCIQYYLIYHRNF